MLISRRSVLANGSKFALSGGMILLISPPPARAEPTTEAFMRSILALQSQEEEKRKQCFRDLKKLEPLNRRRSEAEIEFPPSCQDVEEAKIGGSFDGRPTIYAFADWQMYCVIDGLSWRPGLNDRYKGLLIVDVPHMFVTDLASVPRVFWSILPKTSAYSYPAILHDFLYWTQTTTRDVADLVFMQAMIDFGIGEITAQTLFQSVRYFGQSAWESNAKARSSGEKRVLAALPQDIRVTWDHWKKDRRNFK